MGPVILGIQSKIKAERELWPKDIYHRLISNNRVKEINEQQWRNDSVNSGKFLYYLKQCLKTFNDMTI